MRSELKKRIMKKVYAIWFVKRIAPALFLYMPFLLVVAFRETANEFFVAKVIDNFLLVLNSSGLMGVVHFVFSAISNTSILPALIILASLGVFAFVLRRLVRNVRGVQMAKSY
ncbi:MAG: hypothetical protein ABII97_02575 [Patescibacteria group bacterium]